MRRGRPQRVFLRYRMRDMAVMWREAKRLARETPAPSPAHGGREGDA
ncbi:MAG TPA: hypothetical protein VFX61_16700 [Micromonosporaceae bacterium]|nr:hypothetical protein [Micromonosporaceae bacterium]